MVTVDYESDFLIFDEDGDVLCPVEFRISKWLEEEGDYEVYGRISVTEFGGKLLAQSDPYTWVVENYSTDNALTEFIVDNMVDVTNAILDGDLRTLAFLGDVDPVDGSTALTEEGFEFHAVLTGASTFQYSWFSIVFDPSGVDS